MFDASKLSPATPQGGLSSFANLLAIVLSMDETSDGFSYANYLTCLGLMPGSTRQPTHPFYFPLGFPPEGPLEILPREVAERMEQSFAELREVHDRLSQFVDPQEVAAETVDELGRKALTAVRRLGAALGYRRWDSGESMVKMLQLSQALPVEVVRGAQLVQAISEFGSDCFVWENPQESNNRVCVGALRLVFRLADSESVASATPEKFAEWQSRTQQIAAIYNALFPQEHCIVEFRDHTAATLVRSNPIGPSYAEVIAQRDANRSKGQ